MTALGLLRRDDSSTMPLPLRGWVFPTQAHGTLYLVSPPTSTPGASEPTERAEQLAAISAAFETIRDSVMACFRADESVFQPEVELTAADSLLGQFAQLEEAFDRVRAGIGERRRVVQEAYAASMPSLARAWGNPEDEIYDDV